VEQQRKLEDYLELQRQIENEAKEKCLAEQNKNTSGTSPENV
jgi:hypothetical protein